MAIDRPFNMHGSTPQHVIMVILPSFLLTVIAKYMSNIFLKTEATIARFALEFVVIVMPLILVFTVLTNYIEEVLFSLVCMVLTLILLAPNINNNNNLKKDLNETAKKSSSTLGFVSNARSTINILTGIAILAVDFRIFSRRFAKTKKYGFSLMDVGVGLFVYSNGIVSPEIRGHKNSFNKTLKSAIPLLALGLARFAITKLLGYRVSVSEYGVHWNFFITLAVTKLISSCMLMAIDIKYILFQGILLLLTHETLIQLAFKDYVFQPKLRTDFFSSNREGICSSLGYVSLHFLSIAIGKWLDIKNVSSKKFEPVLFAKLMATIAILLMSTIYTYSEYDISRCLANITYCLWILFIGVFMTTLYYLSDVFQDYIIGLGSIQVPIIFEAINYNGLVYFMVSNLFTGLVNIVFKTEDVGTENSLLILFAYMFVTCLITVLLYVYKIKIKL